MAEGLDSSNKPAIIGCATSNKALFDRGLVPVRASGWTMPEGVQEDYPELKGDVTTDIVVIGAGLAGTSLALHLAKAGVSAVILEARSPGWGASGRNAGHVLPILKDVNLLERLPNGGRAFLEAFRQHHTIPFDLAREYDIDCDAIQSGYLNVMKGRDRLEKFRREMMFYDTLSPHKMISVEGGEVAKLTGTNYWSHGLILPTGGRVNPYLLSNGLAKSAVNLGAQVFANSAALKITPAAKSWKVHTAKGSVTGDRVVFCTNGYPSDIIPKFANSFYPLTAYGLTTEPLPDEVSSTIMPGGQTLAQVPLDLNPLVKDRHNRLILSSIPAVYKAEDAKWHFKNQLNWINRVWPSTKSMNIKLEAYWTGRVAMRDVEFPGVYEAQPGVYGLMHFNAWGNVMAPLMGKLFAEGLALDTLDDMPFPIEKASPVSNPNKQNRIIRKLLIPAARQAQRFKVI